MDADKGLAFDGDGNATSMRMLGDHGLIKMAMFSNLRN